MDTHDSHGNETKKLVMMANQIGDFFATYPHHVAVTQTRQHLEQFWAPPMRAAIIAHLSQGGQNLKPIALEAVKGLKT